MNLNSSGKITVNAEWLRIVSTGERVETEGDQSGLMQSTDCDGRW